MPGPMIGEKGENNSKFYVRNAYGLLVSTRIPRMENTRTYVMEKQCEITQFGNRREDLLKTMTWNRTRGLLIKGWGFVLWMAVFIVCKPVNPLVFAALSFIDIPRVRTSLVHRSSSRLPRTRNKHSPVCPIPKLEVWEYGQGMVSMVTFKNRDGDICSWQMWLEQIEANWALQVCRRFF